MVPWGLFPCSNNKLNHYKLSSMQYVVRLCVIGRVTRQQPCKQIITPTNPNICLYPRNMAHYHRHHNNNPFKSTQVQWPHRIWVHMEIISTTIIISLLLPYRQQQTLITFTINYHRTREVQHLLLLRQHPHQTLVKNG